MANLLFDESASNSETSKDSVGGSLVTPSNATPMRSAILIAVRCPID